MHKTTSRRFKSFRKTLYCFEPLRLPYSYHAPLWTHVSDIAHIHGTHYGYYGHQALNMKASTLVCIKALIDVLVIYYNNKTRDYHILGLLHVYLLIIFHLLCDLDIFCHCLMFRLMFASWPSSFLVLCLSKHIYTCTIYCFQQEIIFTHRILFDLRALLLHLVPALVQSSAVFHKLLHSTTWYLKTIIKYHLLISSLLPILAIVPQYC